MARALYVLAASLALVVCWPAVTLAAPPVGVDVTLGIDELTGTTYITVSWQPVPGAAGYRTVWGPTKQPKTFYSHDSDGKKPVRIPATPGEATSVKVIARDKDGKEIARSPTDVITIPKGKLVGSGTLQTRGLFFKTMPRGTDHQDTRGTIHFRVYQLPSLEKGTFKVYGLGNASFSEKTVTQDGSWSTRATAPVFVTGLLRYPTDAELKKNIGCRMDFTITEAWKGRVAHVNGSVHGIPMHDFAMTWTVKKTVKAFLFLKGHEASLTPDVAHNTYTVKLTEIGANAPGCEAR